MKREEIEKIFALAYQNLLCNTSYPFNKAQYEQFLTSEDILSAVDKLSFYIHIPFCRQLCSFCEYTRFPAGDIAAEECYMDLLNAQIQSFLDSHPMDLTLVEERHPLFHLTYLSVCCQLAEILKGLLRNLLIMRRALKSVSRQ